MQGFRVAGEFFEALCEKPALGRTFAQLARVSARAKEMAVRAALGAGRRQCSVGLAYCLLADEWLSIKEGSMSGQERRRVECL